MHVRPEPRRQSDDKTPRCRGPLNPTNELHGDNGHRRVTATTDVHTE